MRPARRAGRLGVLLVLALAARRAAAAPLHLEARASLDGTVALRLVAANPGTAPARAVRPEVAWEREAFAGPPATLGPGARHEWRFSLPPPPAPGTFPITVRVRHTDASGEARMTPLVTLVSSPDAPPDPVRASFHGQPLSHVGTARVVLENRGAQAVAGRLFLVLPGGLATAPESLPAQVAARDQTTIPLVVEDVGLEAGAVYPAFVLFVHTAAGVHHAALAEGGLSAAGGPGSGRARPLVVGAVALAAAVGLLALALRRTAAHPPRVRGCPGPSLPPRRWQRTHARRPP
jgi:hypothetical protein